ncbi:hypothetical protein A6R68_06778 [Neotoma lepida]|uniref:Actin interacting protein 3-like C-terminal domain-containing protein n=1 Tax=Neotoma lepida TaxID=56216 RepID=A0A1A6GEL1_NEOLE|nr:hypothetical protein A6R68_06778 [Neotoma lepida]
MRSAVSVLWYPAPSGTLNNELVVVYGHSFMIARRTLSDILHPFALCCPFQHCVLYLQYGDETKQLRMPNEITSADTIRALFVSAFPQQLTMKMLESPSVAIYIKDESRNVYYELNDVRNIQDRSLLKVYNKDPSHAFNHMAKAVNGDPPETARARPPGCPLLPNKHAYEKDELEQPEEPWQQYLDSAVTSEIFLKQGL